MKDVPDVVTLDNNTHVISSPFSVNHGLVIVQGSGETVIQIADSTAEGNYGAFSIGAFSTVTICDLEIDGNKAGQGVYVDTPKLVGATGSSSILFQNLHIYDGKGDGIEPNNCSDGVSI